MGSLPLNFGSSVAGAGDSSLRAAARPGAASACRANAAQLNKHTAAIKSTERVIVIAFEAGREWRRRRDIGIGIVSGAVAAESGKPLLALWRLAGSPAQES